MKNKTVLISGANSGIGLVAAREIAKMGAQVVMLCRSAERGKAAQAEVIKDSGNHDVHLLLCDLSSQADIRRAADDFKAGYGRLDVLVNNAGAIFTKRQESVDGLEMTFDEILSLAQDCKYGDCTHTSEKGCAVLAAIENEELDAESYTNFMKMERERSHFESDAQDRKKKDKDLGKMIKRVQKQRRNNKY
mgnify:CR=1 FL=1